MSFWNGKRILVTGGAGFLGSYVVETLRVRERGCSGVFVPRSKDYDLTQLPAVQKLYADSRPDIAIHLAARVGGIGANREHPAEFFYDNLSWRWVPIVTFMDTVAPWVDDLKVTAFNINHERE